MLILFYLVEYDEEIESIGNKIKNIKDIYSGYFEKFEKNCDFKLFLSDFRKIQVKPVKKQKTCWMKKTFYFSCRILCFVFLSMVYVLPVHDINLYFLKMFFFADFVIFSFIFSPIVNRWFSFFMYSSLVNIVILLFDICISNDM